METRLFGSYCHLNLAIESALRDACIYRLAVYGEKLVDVYRWSCVFAIYDSRVRFFSTALKKLGPLGRG